MELINQDNQKALAQFDKLAAEIKQHVEPCMSIVVADSKTQATAYATGKDIKDYQKKVEARRVELVKPLNELVKQINSYAKKISEPLDKAEEHIKGQLKAYDKVLEAKKKAEFEEAEKLRKQAEEEAAAVAAAKQEEVDMASMFLAEDETQQKQTEIVVETERVQEQIAVNHAATVRSINSNKVSGASKTWTFEVMNADEIPREFLVYDEKLIRQAIKEGVREIAGVRIYQDTRIAFR